MKAIELFAGAGGLGIGISRSGFRPIEIVEWDRWCCDTINENRAAKVQDVKSWPEPIHDDIRKLDFSKYEGRVDLVSGGPPCQPFSMGGKHRAHLDKRDMWPEAVRVIRQARPKAFIFENVKGLKRSAFASYLSYIELQLSHPGLVKRADEDWLSHFERLQQHHSSSGHVDPEYRVIFDVLNSANFGVPQRRERLVFVGFRSDLKIRWSFPRGQFCSDSLIWDLCRSEKYWDDHKVAKADRVVDQRLIQRAANLAERPKAKRWLTVRDGLKGLPAPKEDGSGDFLNHRLQIGARAYPGHTGSPLDWPAKTLKAGVHGVPGGENMLVNPDGSVRYFSVRESARLQTFPDQYELHGSWTEAMRQLGNAVPVLLARELASDVAQTLRAAA